jgi:hypothetical protein
MKMKFPTMPVLLYFINKLCNDLKLVMKKRESEKETIDKSQNEKFITLIFGELPPHVTGGAEIFNYYLIKEIAKTHRIKIIGASDPKIDGVQFYYIKNLKPVRLFYPVQLFFYLCKRSTKSSAIYTSYMTASWLMYVSITLFSVIFRIPYSFTIHSGALV